MSKVLIGICPFCKKVQFGSYYETEDDEKKYKEEDLKDNSYLIICDIVNYPKNSTLTLERHDENCRINNRKIIKFDGVDVDFIKKHLG